MLIIRLNNIRYKILGLPDFILFFDNLWQMRKVGIAIIIIAMSASIENDSEAILPLLLSIKSIIILFYSRSTTVIPDPPNCTCSS